MGIATVLIISALYPNNLKFPFAFELNQPWRYADLEAPYDIPVLKPKEALQADLDAVARQTNPVYRYDPEVARSARARFLQDFRVALDSAEANGNYPGLLAQPENHRRYGLRVLDKIYDYGIIQARPEEEMEGMSTVITTLNGSDRRERTISQLYTPGDAREWVTDSLFYTQLKAPDLLRELLLDKFEHNVFYDDSLTNRLRSQALDQVSPYDGLLRKGETIIRSSESVTDATYQQLVSYRVLYNKNLSTQTTFWSVFGGYAVQIGLVIVLLFFYLRSFFPWVYSRWKNLLLILLWPVLYALLVRTVEITPGLTAWIVPFCIVPIVMRVFFTERLAFFVHVAVVLIASFLTSLGYQFTFLSIMAGVVVIVMDIDTRDMGRFLRSLGLLFAYYLIGFIGLELLRGGSWWTVDYSTILLIIGNVFLVLFAYPLILLLEKLFGLVSPITLLELSDMNQPLLEKLARKAPGTWQHSLNVANMAEQAARAVGGDALLVKTAALYHDIGKTENPEYFIENQNGPNPHERLGPKESAAIIINHVADGVKLARQAGLPQVIIEFISTHHGNSRAEFFYRMYAKDRQMIDDSAFRYPGPRPVTKEQTILMIADTVEAACKSLKNPTEVELYTFIDTLIKGKISSGQLENSKLSFSELEICRETFKSVAKSVYHSRIAYPEEE
ncbi:MAG: HDIG domain-containing metalloprotein [Bacteroidota bacterium]